MDIPKQSVLFLVPAVLSDSGRNYPVCIQPALSVCPVCAVHIQWVHCVYTVHILCAMHVRCMPTV